MEINMKSITQTNKKSWFSTVKGLLLPSGHAIKNQEIWEIIEIKDCQITGDKQAIVLFNKYSTETREIKDILNDDDLMAKLAPESIRVLTYLLAKELLTSEFVVQDLKLKKMIDYHLKSLYRRIKKKVINGAMPELYKNKSLIDKYSYLYAKNYIWL